MHTFIVGLPDSGKTSFIAALWQVLITNDVPGAIRLKNLAGESEHLNNIHENWLNAQAVPRTELGDVNIPEMYLEDSQSGLNSLVTIPDISGEVFRVAAHTGVWSQEIDELVRDSTGLLLFVHSTRIVQHIAIDEANTVSGGPKFAKPPTESSDSAWKIELMPTQVVLVKLLQSILSRREPTPLQLSVVASAWDLTKKFYPDPEDWLKTELPFLHQFLDNNTPQLNWKVFGVSAQGGAYPQDQKRLKTRQSQTERIKVFSSESESNDITSPIRWSMLGEQSMP